MAQIEDDLSIEELQANLHNYKAQLDQVEELLSVDPGNAEYEEVRRSLQEVIELTQEVLASQKSDLAGLEPQPSAHHRHSINAQAKLIAQQGASLDIPERLPVGSKVQAVWSEDGEWYDATIEAITLQGYYVVYDEWGNKEEVDVANVREVNIAGGRITMEEDSLFEAEKEAEATRLAIKRKIAESAELEVLHRDLPPKLRINPDDPEDVKAAKKKKIHAFKSKLRLEQMEVTQNKRQNAWQQFQSSKGKSKKVGFFTGRKRESIFKSPEDPKGKVGVTGSGKGITEFHKREKHLHMRVGNEEEDWQ